MTKFNFHRAFLFLNSMRPHQWVKNVFVVIPLLFFRQSNNFNLCRNSLVAFTSFCAMSSAMYVINDMCDMRGDQQHPIKKHRAIASGSMTSMEAVMLSVLLLLLSLITACFLNIWFTLTILLYAIINIVYSLGAKHIIVLDVVIIAVGFALRIVGGSLAINEYPSHWMILCTVVILCFLGFAKRRAELETIKELKGCTRQSLKCYNVSFLDQATLISAAVTIICYSIYTIDAGTVNNIGSRAMLFTMPSVVYGVFRYLYIVYSFHEGEDPARSISRDIPTVINLFIWLLISIIVLHHRC